MKEMQQGAKSAIAPATTAATTEPPKNRLLSTDQLDFLSKMSRPGTEHERAKQQDMLHAVSDALLPGQPGSSARRDRLRITCD